MTEAPKDRASALLATRKQKMDEMFKDKKFEIVKEVHLEGDARFQTPFGNKGRNGYALREVGNPDNKFVIGATMLKQVAEDYGAVEMPEPPPRKRRTKEQKAADDQAQAKDDVQASDSSDSGQAGEDDADRGEKADQESVGASA